MGNIFDERLIIQVSFEEKNDVMVQCLASYYTENLCLEYLTTPPPPPPIPQTNVKISPYLVLEHVIFLILQYIIIMFYRPNNLLIN